MTATIISLTTIPSRMDRIGPTLESLLRQSATVARLSGRGRRRGGADRAPDGQHRRRSRGRRRTAGRGGERFHTLSARELNESIEIISRGERPKTERKLLRAGANRVVLPTAAGASRIARMIANPSAESLLRDGAGMAQLDEQLRQIGLQFVEIPVSESSPLVNTTIDDIDPRDLAAVIIVAVRTAAGEIHRNPVIRMARPDSHRMTRSFSSAGGGICPSRSTGRKGLSA